MATRAEQEIERGFPKLSSVDYDITSPRDVSYNCIAWAAGDDTRFWWPHVMGSGYWPSGVPRETTLEAFTAAFESLGYEVCRTAQLEGGYEKVAIFADGGTPTHAARQLASGLWTSKLGNDVDIQHVLDGVEGAWYGKVVRFMKRPRGG